MLQFMHITIIVISFLLVDVELHLDETSYGVEEHDGYGFSNIVKTIPQIVGGEVVKRASSYPFMAFLSGGGFGCGGTLITKLHVLTAAHCVEAFKDVGYGNLKIYLGTVNFVESRKKRTGEKMIIHTNYNKNTFTNDLGLITMNKPVCFERNIKPACLPKIGKEFAEGTNLIVIGFGETEKQRPQTKILDGRLREVIVPIYNHKNCTRYYKTKSLKVTKNHICAGYPRGNKDSCQGDSGGPLIRINGKNKKVVIGVVSWGDGCAWSDNPGVYVKISSYIGWIQQNIGHEKLCTKK